MRAHKPVPCTRTRYAKATLKVGGWPVREPQIACLIAVMVGEGSDAAWNPLDTTLKRPGATPYNSFGTNNALHVWDYVSAASGVSATVETMRQPNMASWVDLFTRKRVTSEQLAAAFATVAWAYVGDKLPEEIVAAWATGSRSYRDDARAAVKGPGDWPYR